MGHPNCIGCYYYARNTDTCDYWLIADQLRGCPPGEGCTKKITMKEFKKMGYAPKWDRDAGREMWQAGKSDKEIAAIYGIHPSAVGAVRRKEWEKKDQAKQATVAEPEQDPKHEPASCHENTTANSKQQLDFIDALEIIVCGMEGMTAVITASAVSELYHGNLEEARKCVDWLIERSGRK